MWAECYSVVSFLLDGRQIYPLLEKSEAHLQIIYVVVDPSMDQMDGETPPVDNTQELTGQSMDVVFVRSRFVRPGQNCT